MSGYQWLEGLIVGGMVLGSLIFVLRSQMPKTWARLTRAAARPSACASATPIAKSGGCGSGGGCNGCGSNSNVGPQNIKMHRLVH